MFNRRDATAVDELYAPGAVRPIDGGRGSDLVFLEDLTGKGHVTRALGPITNVFLHVPADFDVVAWAAGK